MNLQQVLQRRDVWRGSRAPAAQAVASGFTPLDELLPGGGWPRGALTEIVVAHRGIGELRLLLPALARLSRGDRSIAFIAPPYIPFAPALAAAGVELSRLLLVHPSTHEEHLWAVEASLRAGACAAVLAWPETITAPRLRRWQLAAEMGGAVGVLFQQRKVENSPAALRLQLAAGDKNAVKLHILKRRGGWPIGPVCLEFDHALAVRESSEFSDRDRLPRRAGE
ncbi:MAG TPA: translesion DNA synthesis-associated protein ImuA [Burkholderiales bacterium]